MNHFDAQRLEISCQQALRDAVERCLKQSVDAELVCRMARAAVAVLEATHVPTCASPELKQSQPLQDVVRQIQAVYDDFTSFWLSDACKQTRTYLSTLHERDLTSLHLLGRFAILYTPIKTSCPPLMLIGNNPSWFHATSAEEALANLEEVAGKIPAVNSYRKHDHAFARQLIGIFDGRLSRPDLLDNCVGMNRLWIQTGSDGGQCIRQADRQEARQIVERCERGTRRIIEILRPRAVALVGQPAKSAVKTDFRGSMHDTVFKDCRHPSRGGERQLEQDLRELIEEAGI